jgi:hypothetical protein
MWSIYPPRWIARPVKWLLDRLAGSHFDSGILGTTPGPFTLWWVPAPLPQDAVLHELEHQLQWSRRRPTWGPRWISAVIAQARYTAAYLWGMRRGYWRNPLEVAARRAAGQPD